MVARIGINRISLDVPGFSWPICSVSPTSHALPNTARSPYSHYSFTDSFTDRSLWSFPNQTPLRGWRNGTAALFQPPFTPCGQGQIYMPICFVESCFQDYSAVANGASFTRCPTAIRSTAVPPFYPLRCKAGAAIAVRNKQKKYRKSKSMIRNTNPMSSLASMVRAILKAQRVAIISTPLSDPQTPQTPAVSQTAMQLHQV